MQPPKVSTISSIATRKTCHSQPRSALKEIANKYNKTAAQVALRWGIQRQSVVIPKSNRVARLKENFEVFDFELSEEDMKTIKSLDKKLRTNQPECFWKIDLFA